MSCKTCQAANQAEFPAEICIHHPGLDDLNKSPVWVFPKIRVCPECGCAEFVIPDDELRQLVTPAARSAGT